MYDDEVVFGRFRYQLTTIETPILIWLSLLLYGHIAYEIILPEITAVNLDDAGLYF